MIRQPVHLRLSAEGRFLFLRLKGAGGADRFQIDANGTRLSRGIVVGGLQLEDGALQLTPC